MVNELENNDATSDSLVVTDETLAADDSINGEDDETLLDDLDALKIEFLDLSTPLSNARRSDAIEDIRERVINSKKGIRIGSVRGQKQVVIQRNGVRVKNFVIPVEAQAFTDDQILKWVTRKIRRGDFDQEITTFYNERWSKLKH
jgi:hypothetical protein